MLLVFYYFRGSQNSQISVAFLENIAVIVFPEDICMLSNIQNGYLFKTLIAMLDHTVAIG